MRTYLRKPWGAALAVAATYLVISLLLLFENEGSDDGRRELSDLRPDAFEIAMTPLSAVFVFLAAWAVLRLLRNRSLSGRRPR